MGDYESADVADFGIRQDTFEAVSYFNPVVVVVDGNEHEYATVGSLAANFPFFFEAIGEICLVVTVQIMDGNDGDLSVGLAVVHLPAEPIKARCGLWREDMGKVRDVVGGFRQVLDALRHYSKCGEQESQTQGEPCQGEPKNRRTIRSNYHRYLLYADGRLAVPLPVSELG